MFNGFAFANVSDIESIADTAARILKDYGVLTGHEQIARIMSDYYPGKIEVSNGRVRIDPSLAYDILDRGKAQPIRKTRSSASALAEIYEGPYLDPYDGKYKEWDEDKLLSYIKLAKRLPDVGGVSMLGCPLSSVPLSKKPLYEKLYAFKYGIKGSYAIWDTALCPSLYKLWEIYAVERGVHINEVFLGHVFLVSPLKLGRLECEQILWFRERGLKVLTGTLSSIGLSSPVTAAGAVALHTAEQLFISIMQTALFGHDDFRLGCSLSVADMRTGAFQYGRPEQLIVNAAMSDFAEYYSLPYSAHGGLTDAKAPSFESGVQKLGTALYNIAKGRNGHIAAGLLSIDEVHSPVQMVLDNELCGYLKRVCRGFEVDEAALAFETIGECVEENSLFIDREHTVENMRDSVWIPSVFSREMYGGWQGDADLDRARVRAIEIMEGPPLEMLIGKDCEKKILEVIA